MPNEGARRQYSKTEQIVSAFFLLGAAILFWILFRDITGRHADGPEDHALHMCEEQLKITAHPGYAFVPKVAPTGAGDFYFAWPMGSGLSLGGRAASAHCIVSAATNEVTSLSVNGKQQIWRIPEER